MRKILNIVAWIALIIGVIMIIWKIFGSSPTDLQLIIPFVIFGLVRIWDMGMELKDFKYDVKLSFRKYRGDFNKLSEDLNKIKENLIN